VHIAYDIPSPVWVDRRGQSKGKEGGEEEGKGSWTF
jgi:hypothetical protein